MPGFRMMTNEKPIVMAVPRKVLVVEDDVPLRALLSDVLRDAGLTVIETASADEALDILRSERVELVFADIRIPGAVDGVGLARRIQAEFPDMRIVLTSGRRKADDRTRGMPFIPKPYVFSSVLKKILTALDDN